ncbi:hypothetical protein [Nocardia sp. bgisy118]|uniref:hypothetical protein n=1 Tax=Nocardia sp. bgisy118 TaxID=3413786 RepID=UPI003F4A54A1
MAAGKKREKSPIQSVGDVPEVVSVDAVAVYDPDNGRILLLHQSLTFAGADRTSAEVQKNNALEYARNLHARTDGMAVLHVPDFDASGALYRVDLEHNNLVEISPPVEFPKKFGCLERVIRIIDLRR